MAPFASLEPIHVPDAPFDLSHPGAAHVDSFWAASAGDEVSGTPPLSGDVETDIAIIGAGYTGLSAALTLARAGRSVNVFDRMRPGQGASTRNGGIASGNLRPGHAELTKAFGRERADAIHLEGKAAREDLADFIAREKIECDFKLTGRFTGASARLLKRGPSRWANILAALITAIFVVGGGASFPHYIFIASVEVLCMLVIVWKAWTWPAADQ